MLAMQLQIGLRDAGRVGHIVVNGRSSASVRAGTVFLRPTDRGINWHICDVDTLRHQFPCHDLCRDFAWHAIANAPLDGNPLSAALAFVKMIVPFVPLAFILFSRMR